MSWSAILSLILPKLADTVDRHVTNEGERVALRAELATSLIALEGEANRAAADVIQTEAKGESVVQRTWRPLLMLIFTAIIGREYLVMPLIVPDYLPQDLPAHFWEMLKIGMGGYIVGRSGEKIAERIGAGLRRE